jgi:hypothetical protein
MLVNNCPVRQSYWEMHSGHTLAVFQNVFLACKVSFFFDKYSIIPRAFDSSLHTLPLCFSALSNLLP